MTLPPNYGPDYIRDFQKIYQDLAAKYHVTLIPFLMADIITKDLRYIQADGIHPTAQGSEIIAGTVLKAIHPLLAADTRKWTRMISYLQEPACICRQYSATM